MHYKDHTRIESERDIRYGGWSVVAASGASVCLASMLVYTFPIFLKPLSDEFSWSRETVSSAFAVMAITSALMAAPIGFLADRLGARLVVAGALVCFGALFVSLSALTSELWHLYTIFALLGIVATGASPVAYARAVSSWFARHRGLALAVAISGGSLGGVVHPPVAEAIVRAAGWRTAFLVLGSVVILAGVPIALRFIRERTSTRVIGHGPADGMFIRDALRSRMFWILAVVIFSTSLTNSSTLIHLSALLTDRGVTPAQSALALSLMGLATMCGRLTTGWLVDRFFAARVSCVLLVIASTGAFILSGAQTFATGALAAILVGFGAGGETDVAPYLLSRYFGLRSFSTLFGLMWMAHASAGAIGPVLMGRIFDATGSYETTLGRMAMVTASAASLMLLMPRYERLTEKTAVQTV